MNLKTIPLLFSQKKRYQLLRGMVGLCLLVLPFYLIFRKVTITDLRSVMHETAWWTIPALLFFSFCAMMLQGIRWWVLVRAFTDKLPLMQSLGLHFKSLFYSIFLPNSTVQEAIRSVVAVKHVGAVISWSSAWVNKIIGILVSFAFSVTGLLLLPHGIIPPQVDVIVVALFIIIGLLLVASFSKTITRPLASRVIPLLPVKWLEFLSELRNGIYAFKTRKRYVSATIFLTILVQFSLVTGITFLIRGITGSFFFAECLAFIPLIEMISMAQPFTPNGIGVRDALVAIMFTKLNLSAEQLTIYIIISYMSMFLRLIGAIPVLMEMAKRKK